ncbi:uncharacterized protein B0I36DRAFT_338898 [Microdochium trichocladiopsis]|uniref:Uncharacterized protein n=1 Tax=Microdochium trichocladiopsis TaxID=1682393 RepID=A0A9P9BGC9_9PEZI|nr:uncharacterized protein B0I36DRAFT_338898 [Microdochium trichocladiopsis]KAH7014564.1 hypothetical protein B0I36DRAFT_338898 [Microdochium trichocladiopsis]
MLPTPHLRVIQTGYSQAPRLPFKDKLRLLKKHTPLEAVPLLFVCGFMLSVAVATAQRRLGTDVNLRLSRQNRLREE